jgi:pyrroline-5-carboxylate reductase
MATRASMMVLGCGNMAQAIIQGLYKVNAEIDFITYTPSITKAKALAEEVSGKYITELDNLPECDYYLIACKPQQLTELVKATAGKIPNKSIIISILAGTNTKTLSEAFNNSKIIRIMPNTPSLVGHGVNAFYTTAAVTKEEKSLITNYFSMFSEVFNFEEEDKIDIITGFSGSGPAYIFEFSRIMIQKMVKMGISEEVASGMVKHTFLGASKLMVESEDDPETLRNKVTSKKGVTYEALEVFKIENTEEIFGKALDAAYKRSIELSKNIDK